MSKEIKTAKDLQSAIIKANIVLAQLRFGNNEAWVKISKKEALEYVKNVEDTLVDDMPCGYFATFNNDTVYLG